MHDRSCSQDPLCSGYAPKSFSLTLIVLQGVVRHAQELLILEQKLTGDRGHNSQKSPCAMPNMPGNSPLDPCHLPEVGRQA